MASKNIIPGVSIGSLTNSLVSQAKKAVAELKEVDTALTEISKTSNMTASALKQLGNDSFETAGKLGKKATDYLNSVRKMYGSGFSGEIGRALAEQSLLAQSVGNMTEEMADKWVIATNAAYEYGGAATKINAVLDGVNNMTNRNSINMASMADAMSTVGKTASQAGIAVDELSAILGISVSATKREGSEIGQAWQSLISNLQDTSSDRITQTLDRANVAMTETKNGIEQLRNPVKILKDLAEIYNSLGEAEPLKSEITASIGGSAYADVLGDFLKNYSQYETLLNDYATGSGSAMKEAEQTTSSWEGSLNRLSSTWTDTIGNIVDSGGVTAAVNMLNNLLSTVSHVTDALGPLGSIGVGAGLFAGFKNAGRNNMLSLTGICL